MALDCNEMRVVLGQRVLLVGLFNAKRNIIMDIMLLLCFENCRRFSVNYSSCYRGCYTMLQSADSLFNSLLFFCFFYSCIRKLR